MPKRLKTHHKLELLGLVLLLVAAGAQIFFNDRSQMITTAEFYRVNDKLNHFWSWHHDLAVHRFQMNDQLSKELSDLNDRFFAEEHSTEPLEHETTISFWLYLFLYSAGTVAFILGRYLAFRSRDSAADI